MPPNLLFPLAILSSLLWSSLDLPRKWLVAELPPETAIFYICLFQGLAFSLLLFFPVFWGALPNEYWPLFAIDVLICCAFKFSLLKSFSLAPLSAVSPLLALSPVATFVFGFFFLGEPLAIGQILGSGAILVGAFLLPERKPGEAWQATFFQPASAYMILAALLLGLTMVLDKQALDLVSFPVHGALLSLGISALMFLTALGRYHKLPLPTVGQYRNLGLSTFFGVAALSTQLMAIAQMPAGVFESLKRSSCAVFTILLSWYFLKEQIGWRKVLACGLMVIGLLVSSN